ncbi:unnamed protein product, partial [Allacma fusca]
MSANIFCTFAFTFEIKILQSLEICSILIVSPEGIVGAKYEILEDLHTLTSYLVPRTPVRIAIDRNSDAEVPETITTPEAMKFNNCTALCILDYSEPDPEESFSDIPNMVKTRGTTNYLVIFTSNNILNNVSPFFSDIPFSAVIIFVVNGTHPHLLSMPNLFSPFEGLMTIPIENFSLQNLQRQNERINKNLFGSPVYQEVFVTETNCIFLPYFKDQAVECALEMISKYLNYTVYLYLNMDILEENITSPGAGRIVSSLKFDAD